MTNQAILFNVIVLLPQIKLSDHLKCPPKEKKNTPECEALVRIQSLPGDIER